MELVFVGKVVKPHGLHGVTVVKAYSDTANNLRPGEKVFLKGTEKEKTLTIATVSPNKNMFRVGWEEIKSRDDAEEIVGLEISVSKESLAEPGEGRFYVFELVGCNVLDKSGHSFGTVEDVQNIPANDILVVTKNGKTNYVPMVREFIKNVDLNSRKIIIEPIEGLFEE